MLSALLILLPTALGLVASSSLEDYILSKQEECDTIQKRFGNPVLDEVSGNSNNVPGFSKKYLYTCRENLDRLKLKYMKHLNLDPSFYPHAFPIRLSNGTIVFMPVPSKPESKNISDRPSCTSCEGLCMVHEKCSVLLDDIARNNDPSEVSYYKMKYDNCVELLDEQKLKFIGEYKIREDMLRGASHVSVNCHGKTIVMPLPESAKYGDENSSNTSPHASFSKNADVHNTKLLSIASSYNHKDNEANGKKRIDGFIINSIPKKDQVMGTKNFRKIYSNNLSKVSSDQNDDLNYSQKGNGKIYPNKDEVSTKKSVQSNDIGSNIKTSHSSAEYNNKKRSYKDNSNVAKSAPFQNDGEPNRIPSNDMTKATDNTNKSPPAVLLVNTKQGDENKGDDIVSNNIITDDTSNTSHRNNMSPNDILLITISQNKDNIEKIEMGNLPVYHHKVIPLNEVGRAKYTKPIRKTIGDAVVEKEDACEAILREANEVIDHQTPDAVLYYDNKYANCLQYLNALKKRYIQRNGLNLQRGDSLLPIILSSGVQRLVALPMAKSGEVEQSQQLPLELNPDADEITFQNAREGTASRYIDEAYGSVGSNGRTQMFYPLPSNQRFYQYFSTILEGDAVSTFMKLTKMIRMNAGQSERRDDLKFDC